MKNLLPILTLICLTACTNEAIEPEVPVAKGTFLLHLHAYVGLQEVDLYGINYKTPEGRTMSLDFSQLYISDVQLVKADGSLYAIKNKGFLKNLKLNTYEIGQVPVGNYKSIRFKVGLPPSINALNPSTPSDSAMLNQPSMWWGNTAQPGGYVFLNVQGKIDTSHNMNKNPVPFVYKIGTNANYVQVQLGEKEFAIEADAYVYGHIIVDYSKLFTGITLNQASSLSVKTVAENNAALGQKIAKNIPAMFNYE
jgi:hypothetical protein